MKSTLTTKKNTFIDKKQEKSKYAKSYEERNKNIKPLYIDIDDFYIYYRKEREKRAEQEKQKIMKNQASCKIITPSTRKHAKDVVEIYNNVYCGTYPYKEMLDPQFVYNTFHNPQYYWRIIYYVEPSHSKTKKHTPVGCFTIVLDKKNKIAYFRGLNVKPAYQGKVKIKEMAYDLIWDFLDKKGHEISKWYNESRSAHIKSQLLSYLIGGHTCAILYNKDYFFNKKETDILMASYKRDAINIQREPPLILTEKVNKIYEAIMPLLGIQEEKTIIKTPEHTNTSTTYPKNITHPLNKKFTRNKYGYVTFLFERKDTGEFLKGIFTESVKTIEKIEYKITKTETFLLFFEHLQKFITKWKVEYVEWYIPVKDLLIIEFFEQKKIPILGYLPAWKWDDDIKKYRDVVIFGWCYNKKKEKEIILLEEATLLLKQVEEQIQKPNPNILQKIFLPKEEKRTTILVK